MTRLCVFPVALLGANRVYFDLGTRSLLLRGTGAWRRCASHVRSFRGSAFNFSRRCFRRSRDHFFLDQVIKSDNKFTVRTNLIQRIT